MSHKIDTRFIRTLKIIKSGLHFKGERSGRVLASRLSGCGFEPQWLHCVVSLGKTTERELVICFSS